MALVKSVFPKINNVGANFCITKPATFKGWVKVIKFLKDYWLEVVELPRKNG